jgi:hypothetical protein
MVTPAPALGPSPMVSVIIATFNWSAALSLAIRSVLGQTLQAFEILVVGDACTDDSEAVVAAFGDARIRWLNLAQNSGSQYGPNNAGLNPARGEWIAYLGHDDIWAPRHLDSTVRAARAAGAQAGVGGLIMYGPPGSEVIHTAGIFAEGRCSDSDFVPPSALVHRRALADQIGRWTDPRLIRLPTDCDFFQRVRAAGGVAPSNEVTVFKFNAAARRNAYQIKSTREQEQCLAALQGGDRYVAKALTGVLAAAAAGRWRTIRLPETESLQPGEIFRVNRVAKGVELRFPPDQLRNLTQRERFGLEREPIGVEWWEMEDHPQFGAFRWTGAGERSTIELPIRLDRRMAVRICVLATMLDQSIRDLTLEAHGAAIPTRLARAANGTWIVSGEINPSDQDSFVPYVQLAIRAAAARPADIGANDDQRRLGVAVSWIELVPLDRGDAGEAPG